MYKSVALRVGVLVLIFCMLVTGGLAFASIYSLNYENDADTAIPIRHLSRSPQPDTLLYDDGSPATLITDAGSWVDVRFSVPVDFTLRAVYLVILNTLNNSTDPCTLYVFDDSSGLPGTILGGPYSFTVPDGYVWHQLDIDSLMFDGGDDFHIMYGPTVGGGYPSPGPGWWALFDAGLTGDRTKTTTDWVNYVDGPGDAFIRAGGSLTGSYTDLSNICTGNQQTVFFPCTNDPVTLTAQIINNGNIDISSYNVEWSIYDILNSSTVFTVTGSYGPLNQGVMQTVNAPSDWTAAPGHYTVWSDVDVTGDVDATNDSSKLALQVNPQVTASWNYYDDGGFESTFSTTSGNAWGTEFQLCDASVLIDSISMNFGLSGAPDSADISILLNDGTGGEPNTELWRTRALVSTGWNTIATGGVKVDSGSFTLAYYYVTNIGLRRDDTPPIAGLNDCMPTVTWYGAGSPTTWDQDPNGNWAMRVHSRPYYLLVDEIRPYRSDTGVDEESPGAVEIYNPSGASISLSGWNLSGGTSAFVVALPAWTLPENSYLRVVLDTGTNDTDFSDRLGIYYAGFVDTVNLESGEIGLYNGSVSTGNLVDFVTWGETGPPMGVAYAHATNQGIWTSGDFLDVTDASIFSNFGRIPSGYDTDASNDWYDFRQTLMAPLFPDNAIQLIPGDGMAFDTVPNFAWRNHRDATQYLFEVDDDSLFGSPLISITTSDTTYSSSTITDGNYYWRVIPTLPDDYPAALFEFSKLTFSTDIYGRVSVPQKYQHKDSKLLCIWELKDGDTRWGCDRTAGDNGPWDGPHPTTKAHIEKCKHCGNYCTRASIQAINHKYGGSLTQDEITFHMKNDDHAGYPEGDLGHGEGAWPQENNAYTWALNGANITENIQASAPIPLAALEAEIDQGQPVLTVIRPPGWFHTVVFDGYFDLLSWEYIHMTDPWPGRTGWYKHSRMPVLRYYVINTANPTGRAADPLVSQDSDGDGVMDFDEGHPRLFQCSSNDKDTDNDEVNDKQEIENYTFHLADHPTCPNIAAWWGLTFPDIDGDGLRAENDCDSDNDSDFDGGENINGDGRVPVGGMETCSFDPGALEIWIASLQVPGPWLCVEDVYLYGQTYHENSWYPYELISGCPTPQDSTGLGWSGILTSIANGVIPLQYIGTFGSGLYRVVVDVLRDNHYSAPDNWDPWLCFAVPAHVKLIIDVPDASITEYYTQALDGLGLQYEINVIPPTYPPATPTPGPPYDYLLQFDVVIWVTGNGWYGTLTPTDAYNLGMYLDNGGKLLITGQDIGYDIWEYSEPNDTTRSFYTNYLGAEYVQNNVGLEFVRSAPGTHLPYYELLPITGHGGANYPDFNPDEVDANDYGMTEAVYDSGWYNDHSQSRPPSRSSRQVTLPGMDEVISSGGAIIANEDSLSNSRSLYYSFAFEGITDPLTRQDLLGASLAWLYGSYVPPESVSPVISLDGDDIVLQWQPSPGAMSYRIYASEDPNFVPDSASLIGGVETNSFVDPNANELMEKRFYVVTAVGNVPVESARDELRDWIGRQTDVDVVREELDRRKIRYIMDRQSQTEYEKQSSFNHHKATEPEYLKTGIR